MSDTIFYWNIIGLGRSRARLKKFLKKFNPNLFAISEPFVAEDHMHDLGDFLNTNYNFHLSNEAQGGKLWLFWNDPNIFEVLGCSNQSISGWVVLDGMKTLVTFVWREEFYGRWLISHGSYWEILI